MITAGVMNMLKPPGMTSFGLTSFVRRCFHGVKAGHTGTLDPAATGVLPVCLGRATGLASFWTACEKTYRAEMTLGVTTDTQDATGKPLTVRPVAAGNDIAAIRQVLSSMSGSLMQIPPMYSAVRSGGKHLYELARQGREIPRKARPVKIHAINLISVSGRRVLFDVRCSSGTYVRTLCADIGEKLGCGACMSGLIRLACGPFRLEEAVTVERLENLSRDGREEEAVLSVNALLDAVPVLKLNNEDREGFLSGAPVAVSLQEAEGIGATGSVAGTQTLYRICDREGCLLGTTTDLRGKTEEDREVIIIGKRHRLV